MSVLIKDMEIPCACVFCELYDGDLYWCRGAKKEVPYSPEDKRAEFCPLVPVPPHGRLIDADALMNLIREHSYPLTAHFNSTDYGMFTIGIQQAVDETPTIIEAEEGQE